MFNLFKKDVKNRGIVVKYHAPPNSEPILGFRFEAIGEGLQERDDIGAKHAPDSEPDKRVKCARTGTPGGKAGPLWRHHLRQEPGAVVPHAGICAGGAEKPASLPRPRLNLILPGKFKW